MPKQYKLFIVNFILVTLASIKDWSQLNTSSSGGCSGISATTSQTFYLFLFISSMAKKENSVSRVYMYESFQPKSLRHTLKEDTYILQNLTSFLSISMRNWHQINLEREGGREKEKMNKPHCYFYWQSSSQQYVSFFLYTYNQKLLNIWI